MKKINYIDKEISTQSLKKLQKRLKRNLSALKKKYKEIIYSIPDNNNKQILFDNYYIIEKITKMLLVESKDNIISVNSNGLPLLGNLIFDLCKSGELPDTDELISAINIF